MCGDNSWQQKNHLSCGTKNMFRWNKRRGKLQQCGGASVERNYEKEMCGRCENEGGLQRGLERGVRMICV